MQVEIAVKCKECDGTIAPGRIEKDGSISYGSMCMTCYGQGYIFKKAEICFVDDDNGED